MAGTGDKLMTAADVKIVTDTCFKNAGGTIDGNTTITGVTSITNTTASSSKTTGALKVSGGVGVSGTVYANGFNGPLTGTASRATADADGNTISSTYLKLTGGTMSGNITRSSSLTKGTNPSSDTYFTSHVVYQNGTSSGAANRVGGLIESSVRSNGDSQLRFGAYQYSSGSSTLNALDIKIAKDGTTSYSMTSPANFRDAINALKGTATEITSSSDLDTFTETGLFHSSTSSSRPAHSPENQNYYMISIMVTSERGCQLIMANSAKMYFRLKLATSGWTGWKQVTTTAYTPPS